MEFWPQTDKHLPQNPFTGQFFKMTTFCIAFCESYLYTGTGLITDMKSTIFRLYELLSHHPF
jgi:hypothetical protein